MATLPEIGKTPTFNIPVVDLSAFLQGKVESEAVQDLVEQIRLACSTSGFFQIIGHGVSLAMQDSALRASKALFSLPEEEKLKLKERPGVGYETFGAQILEAGRKPDLKEGYFINREIPGLQPPYKPFCRPNIWPQANLLPETEFKLPLLAYHTAMQELAVQLMDLLAKSLNVSGSDMMLNFCREPIAAVRLLHYPPHPDVEDDALVGAGAHTDFGGITILLTDGNSGLQVLDQATNEWIDVPARSDAFVVNMGDLLETWTSGYYKSNIHRVINKSGKERYSVPFFFDGNPDFVVEPLDGSATEIYTVQEHLLKRYEQSF
ncbi:Oxoglutarate/iron-dependent oxygenase [Akanthomyces lecanii RCEF 1005]|uniref:Oxoglutarate/iron-dependent oxygenase n=1 Tax=Akanthomyces lecanii RCEF 1005 TaxID=1081108 RepID=A0A168KVN2_CORDF|nr:Oxoglutarate/iron-dependent oxygenase [Akanthomyces lecanii RCEF 1005]